VDGEARQKGKATMQLGSAMESSGSLSRLSCQGYLPLRRRVLCVRSQRQEVLVNVLRMELRDWGMSASEEEVVGGIGAGAGFEKGWRGGRRVPRKGPAKTFPWKCQSLVMACEVDLRTRRGSAFFADREGS
jgi:hypothetical protein